MYVSGERKLWQNARLDRGLQHFCGSISAFFFAIALLSLFDGLQAKMRVGPQEFDLLPGEELIISGPCAIKNPVSSDVLVRWMPPDAPINFTLEGFYTGYWFGSGMWRAKLTVLPQAKTGSYSLALSFRGAPAQNIQHYIINIFENQALRRDASRSVISWLLDLNPFSLSTILGALALLFAICTYIFGMRYAKRLAQLGLFEIYRIDARNKLACCLVPKTRVPSPGSICNLISPKGKILGSLRTDSWNKGKLSLSYDGKLNISTNDLVCLDDSPCCFLFKKVSPDI